MLLAKLFAQPNQLIIQDTPVDSVSPASLVELVIPSEGSHLQGLMYKASGREFHPTIFLLHGFPGNERNLDLAQVLRSKGWNVIYFNYRGSWGSQGKFSFKNCVQDVVNAVRYIEKEKNRLLVDVNNLFLFGHSMGGWVTLKAIQELPEVKKAFVLSAWNIASTFSEINTEEELISNPISDFDDLFVLNNDYVDIFKPVLMDPYYDLKNDSKILAQKKIFFLDEHQHNSLIVESIRSENEINIKYQVWDTDHSFSTKRVSLINQVIDFFNEF